MQIVIDIDENLYTRLFDNGVESNTDDKYDLEQSVRHGTPLPKGHGRLIDADEYKEHLYACETNGRPLHIMELDERLTTVDDAPTIIEADKAESEDKE